MSRPTWTVASAARACGVARSTIQRALRDDRLPGAVQGPNGWAIPTEALLEAGFSLQQQGMPEPDRATASRDSNASTPLQGDELQKLRNEVMSLQAALQVAQARETAARAVADERERTIQIQQLALRALESRKVHEHQDQHESAFTHSHDAETTATPPNQPEESPSRWSKLRARVRGY